MKFKRNTAFTLLAAAIMFNSLSVPAAEKNVFEISTASVDAAVSEGALVYTYADVALEGSGTVEAPYKISSAEELSAIRNDLSAHYVLTADIDLSAAENWQPIGAFSPLGQSGEDAETPNPQYAFTGSFDGAGHTISGLKCNIPGGFCVGIFGCASEAEIKNIVVKNAEVTGSLMVGCVAGYSYDSTIKNIRLENCVLTNVSSEMGADMIGGIAGAGMDSVISDCSADAVLNLVDGTSNSGIVVGG